MFVAGGIGVAQAMQDRYLIRHVRRLANGATRVASVCTGAFVLAASGLLSGRRATTHWEWCGPMAAMFPDIEFVPDAIYVRDGDVWTSAGVTAGIDLALSFIVADHGQQAAALVARHLVVYLQRSGGQAQFSLPLAAQAAEREPLRQLLAWAIDNPASDLTVAALARRMNLSERQFAACVQVGTRRYPGRPHRDDASGVRVQAARNHNSLRRPCCVDERVRHHGNHAPCLQTKA